MNAEKQKTVLITGASGGIGKATVKAFAERGYRVVGVGRSAKAADFPTDGLYIQADLTKLDSFELIFESLRDYCDCLDVLVNNAAYQITKPLLETTVEEWDAVMATNLRPAFLMWRKRHIPG